VLKNYALILGAACPLWVVMHAGELRRRGRPVLPRLAWMLGTLALVGGFALLAWLGHNPLSRLEGEGGGVGQYGRGVLLQSAGRASLQLAVALGLQLHLLLIASVRRGIPYRRAWLPLLMLGGVYFLGLTPFPTSFYNMRYFLPLFPLAALPVAHGLDLCAAPTRRIAWTAFLLINGATTLIFNWLPCYETMEPHLPRIELNYSGVQLDLLDNLRMPQHRDTKQWLDAIDRNVEPGAVLYLMNVGYYRDAQHDVYERDGLIRPDITTRYASQKNFAPAEPRFYVWFFSLLSKSTASPQPLERFGRVTGLGNNLFRVDAAPTSEGH